MNWPLANELQSLPSPALLVDADLVDANTQRMIRQVEGRVDRLRPHIKTHKMPAVIRAQVSAGVTQFKAATLSEAEMASRAGASDVLLAYQPVGPNIRRYVDLLTRHPSTQFSAVVDDQAVVGELATAATGQQPLGLFIDVDVGMHRTGVPIGAKAERLAAEIQRHPSVRLTGLHVYDGHLHMPSAEQREHEVASVIRQVADLSDRLGVTSIVAGGSPTFPFWARRTDWQCGPGTTVFWDIGYTENFPEMGYAIAAGLLTRVVSKPGDRRLCFDLGYKAVASEMPLPSRVTFPELEDAQLVGHSEEHLMVETTSANEFVVGQPALAFPRHICPTVARYAHAHVVREGHVTSETWPITARDR